jgi:hypothetical protein
LPTAVFRQLKRPFYALAYYPIAGLPGFSWCMIPKLEKYTNRTQNVSNDHKTYNVSKKFVTVIRDPFLRTLMRGYF